LKPIDEDKEEGISVKKTERETHRQSSQKQPELKMPSVQSL